MKKLALLFGALSLVSSVAYAKEVVPVVEEVVVVEEAPVVYAAAPALKVTNVGQYLEIDNTSGSEDIGEAVHLGNYVGLSYADWTFDVMARKTWSMDTDDGIHSEGHRLDLAATRNFENGYLGAKWRQETDMDRYYLRGGYNYDMFSGWADVAYQSNNGNEKNDNWYVEAVPVQLNYGPMFINYHIEGTKVINPEAGNEKSNLEHQVRLGASYAVTDALGLSAEYRYQFDQSIKFKGEHKGWQENNKHVAILGADYKVTEALSLNGYYEYDFNRYKGHGEEKDPKNYYGEFCIGWDYKF